MTDTCPYIARLREIAEELNAEDELKLADEIKWVADGLDLQRPTPRNDNPSGQKSEEQICLDNAGRTYDWLHKDLPISGPQFDDEEVARQVRMLLRDDLEHPATCVMARDRIMALVKEKAQLVAALENIANYTPPDELRECSDDEFGLDPDEAIDMAYENVIEEAKSALRRIPIATGGAK